MIFAKAAAVLQQTPNEVSKGEVPKAKTPEPEVRAPSGGVTWVGPDLTVIGVLEGRGRVEIHGLVDGDVKAQAVTIAESGRVEGEIMADYLQVRGAIDGPVRATTVEIARTARVVGNITHCTLTVEAGAQLEGRRPWRPNPLGNEKDQYTFSETD